MKNKRFFALLIFIQVITTVWAGAGVTPKNSNTVTLALQSKVSSISEGKNFYIFLKDIFRCTNNGEIFVLSKEKATVHRFDPKLNYIGSFLKSGEGPLEVINPRTLVPLSNNRLLVANKPGFFFYEMKKDKIVETKRMKTPYNSIGDFEEYTQDKLFVLSAFSLKAANPMKAEESGKLLHIYDMKNQKKVSDFFETPSEIGSQDSNDVRSKYGSGDIIYFDNLLFLVYNQPGEMYIFNPNGTINKKISTKFPFVKYNNSDIKTETVEGAKMVMINYANTCRMNLLVNNKMVYLITRINYGTNEEPSYKFYLSLLDYKNGRFINHLPVVTPGVDISQADFKCFNGKNLIFLDEDYIYSFSIK